MEEKGRILDVSRDWKAGSTRVYLEIPGNHTEELDKLADKDISVSIRRYREKRSLDANAYYWVLAGKLAAAMKITNAAMHNILLRRYGAYEAIDGKMVFLELPDTDEAEEKALEAEAYHIKPTSEIRTGDDVNYRTYIMLKGSHDYDTAEMSRLIDGTVEDCKACGIETATPDDLERMKALYEKKHHSGI